ncbi:MAG: polyprenyl synthetase family protein [Armatimonadetes bacterium]|nr:polyprenyl synthetase family protein [Armatimonadota bacterium]
MSGPSSTGSGLDQIYAPVAEDLGHLARLLRRELASSDPFISGLVDHVLSAQGKLIRPALALLSASACGGADDQRLHLAATVELVHVASLIHDDIIDAADLRRGVPTVNERWGNQIAVLVGDYMFATAFRLASRIRHARVAPALAEASVLMSRSEIMAASPGDRPHEDEARYYAIIEGKTAALFSAACRCGALLAGAPPDAADAMAEFGLRWGVAFQITDDALDLVGDPGLLGKPTGSDASTGKITLPVIAALRNAPGPDRDRLLSMLKRPSDPGSRDEMRGLLVRHGGLRYAMDAAQRSADAAAAALDALPDGPAKASLLRLADFVVARTR